MAEPKAAKTFPSAIKALMGWSHCYTVPKDQGFMLAFL